MKKLLFIFSILSCTTPHNTCENLDPSTLENLVSKEKKVEVVFFASWCSSCKSKYEEKTAHKRIFVAAFDEKDAAGKVCSKYKIKECYLSKGLTEHWKVGKLPFSLMWENGKFRK